MLWRDLKVWQVHGANTNVGKTIVSTILCKALQRRAPKNGVLYLKPVSTGPQSEADDRHISNYAPGVVSQCLSQFSEPVSPHLAAQLDSIPKDKTDDKAVVSRVRSQLLKQAEAGTRYALLETAGGVLSPGPSGSVQADLYRPLRLPTLLVGDHHLGGISTTISAFESLHVRGYDVDSLVLFDDPKWGNFTYLREYLTKFNIRAFSLPPPPTRQPAAKDDELAMAEYYEKCSGSDEVNAFLDVLNAKHFSRISKLTSMPSKADSIVWHPFRQHGIAHNIIAMDSAYGDNFEAYNQEADPSITLAADESSTGLGPAATTKQEKALTTPLFDASASWWTQGFGHGNPDLSLTAANAAGRYGHVMFAHAVHEPALDLCYNLLETVGNPRLARVFFTDNGSTAMEVAIKMALRASSVRYNWHKDDGGPPIEILGLKGSYHGDTIGVMNASEPSVFNKNVDWYKPQGVWLDPPQVIMREGVWQVSVPEQFREILPGMPLSAKFQELSNIFDYEARNDLANFYKGFLRNYLKTLVHDQGRRLGALVMEPIVMGAGGMIFVDPLFQRTLINLIRSEPTLIKPSSPPSGHLKPGDWAGLPVIADEVFTGLYRLGRASSSSFLGSNPPPSTTTDLPPSTMDIGISPDICAHAKLLTGGLLPLALTTASDSIFQAFYSDSKPDALLHGHSYTAHAVGCAVSNRSLAEMKTLNTSPTSHWNAFRSAWPSSSSSSASNAIADTPNTLSSTIPAQRRQQHQNQTPSHSHNPWSVFPPEFIKQLSHHPCLSGVWSLGTVLAITMAPPPSADANGTTGGGGGYASNVTASLQARLLTTLDPTTGEGIHARVLGDVIYFMTSLTTTPDTVGRISRMLARALDEEMVARQSSV